VIELDENGGDAFIIPSKRDQKWRNGFDRKADTNEYGKK